MTISGHQSRRGAGRSRPPDEGGNQRHSGALRCTQRRFEALSELQSRAPRHSASYNLELRGTPSADLDVRRRKPAQDLIRSKRGREEGIRPGRRSRCDEHLQGRSSVAVSGHVPLLRPTITAIISSGEGLQQVRGQDRISSKGDPRGRRRSHQIEDGADEQHRIGHGW